MQCRECHAELPQGARRCPQCGRPVLHEKIWNNKRLRALLIGITIVLIAVGAGFAVVASQDAAVNSRVKDAICNFQFDTAETLRGDVKLFPAGDNSLRTEIIRTGRLYQAGQYTQALMYLDDLRETYTDAGLAAYSGVLDTIEAKSLPQIYAAASEAYSAQDYQTALADYTVLAARNYSDSDKRLFLTNAHLCDSLGQLALTSGMTNAQAAQKLMEEYATLNDATTRREEWMAVQAIVTGTIPIVGEGVNETIDFGLTNKKTLTGDNKWGGTKADILGNLGDWTDAVLHGGFANVDTIIMGKTAKAKFFADANVQKMLDNRRMNLGEIAPRDLPNGVKYLGHLNDPSLDMYVYGEVYYDDWTNPDAPETKPLIPDNMIILISSRPNYMMAYGACTYIEDASGLWVTSQTSRVLRSYVEHHPDRRMVELQAHPLPIPDKVDSWLVATVC